MSAEYRQKLVNWLTSMLVLSLLILATSLYDWLEEVYSVREVGRFRDEWLYGPLGEALRGYIIFFVLLWFWHMADFFQQAPWSNPWLMRFTDHRLISVLLLLLGASLLFYRTDWLNDLGCPEVIDSPAAFAFDGCGAWTPWWKDVIFLALVLALLGLTIMKVVLVLASYVTRMRKWALSLLQSGDKVSP
ncbi:hypothetical protein [Erythrobacter sp. EC-HK427]|uniref:hypothetical protein n=1 Tax=Erythrobacter sp. EC-HK427 TaxID=2038396 RepID=UPI00125ECC87|nr:hypothetical protein [Erythrobacter sp. EC-HK427]